MSAIYILYDPAGFEENTGSLRYLDGSLPAGDTDEDWWNMVYRWTDCPVLTGLDLGSYGPDATQSGSGDSQAYMSQFYIGFRGAWNEGLGQEHRPGRASVGETDRRGRLDGCGGRLLKRLRLVRRWKKPRRPGPVPAAARPPRPSELDNPYAPCYGQPRSFAQLRPK